MPADAQPRITARLKNEVYNDYGEHKPGPDHEYEAWAEDAAERFGLTTAQVKRIIAEQSSAMLFKAQQAQYTEAQQTGRLLGLTLARAIAVINDGLDATKREILKDRDGPIVDEDGEPRYFEQPDWRARMDSARMAMQLHGGFAPEWVNIDQNVNVRIENQTDEQLAERLAGLLPAIGEYVQAHRQRGAADSGRTESKAGRPRQVLLADPVHRDKG